MTTTLATILSILLILGAASLLLIIWALVYRPHPRIEGKLHVSGLDAAVEVLRDRWGVPHIYAETEHDLWFAQGFVHAQDRLWQMEQLRRVAAGRMSEGVGEEGMQLDRFSRIIGFRRIAVQQEQHLAPEARLLLEHYTEGVNSYIIKYKNRLPLEFTLLGIKPEPWTLTDSLSITSLFGWALTVNWREEIARVGLFTRLGAERAAELIPDYDKENPIVLPGELTDELSRKLLQAYNSMQDYIGLRPPGQGSNNWVINGSKTISGKPLLANDPHLSVTIPNIWYLAHLETKDERIRMVGASMTGNPGVVLGHNQHIAWGATAAFPDTADVYVEQRHPQRPDSFRYGEHWEQAETLEEEIYVRGQDEPVIQRVTITRHGPLLTDLLSERESNYPPLAIRWAGAEPGCNANALSALALAHDWQSFRQAAAELVTPALSLVYADKENNIGFIAAGRVPIRAQGNGLVPSPGYTGTHEWTDFIPLEELPQGLNPESGQFLSSNNRIVGDDYSHWWGLDHYPGYRARRIAELLDQRPRHSLRDFQTMQLDTYSYLGRIIAPYFTLIDPQNPWERRAQQALLEWNYRMESDSTAALVFEMVLYHLLQLVFSDKLGANASDYLGIARFKELEGGPFEYQALVKLTELLEKEESWWFGEGSTGKPRNREALLTEALKRAVQTLKQEISDDARRWQWGRLHQISWQHPLGVLKPLRGLLNRGPFPVSGSAQTINSQHWEYAFPIRTITVAPTYRMVIDLANWDRSTFVTCPGQSGLPGQRFYDNLLHIWLEGESIPMAFSRHKVEQSDPLYRLQLTPD